MATLLADAPGTRVLILGNEAIARGAIEAGVKVVASYPGTPSSEITETLSGLAKEAGIHVEWSVNEKVAAEVAGAASYAGVRALTCVKHEGLNVALDFLSHLNLTGTVGGIVLVCADDPQGWSSPGENDSRPLLRWFNVPLMEPATAQEAKDMTRWAFDLSDELKTFCIIRSCTRVSHATGDVVLGEIRKTQDAPHFDISRPFCPQPVVPKHAAALAKTEAARAKFEESPFNSYEGPEKADLIVAASGSGRLYAQEAIQLLGVGDKVGILHVGTTWPLPVKFIGKHITKSQRIVVFEDVDPFLEVNLKHAAADQGWLEGGRKILGKESGHVPRIGELNPEIAVASLSTLLGVDTPVRDAKYDATVKELAGQMVIDRPIIWCPGCPHRGSFWAIKNALRIDGREGFVTGDIGCYGLDLFGGYQMVRTLSAMGAGTGVANGMGQLQRFGFNQPVVAVCGDSTFFHATIPALLNAKYNRSNFTMIVLDNSATAMTGFQPHPGVGRNAVKDAAPQIDIAEVCRGFGFAVEVLDPFDVPTFQQKILASVSSDSKEVRVFVARRECALIRPKDAKPPFKVWVDQEKCLGDACGCGRFCVQFFRCPGLVWDEAKGRARIDEAVCVGCGVCTNVCSTSSILKEATIV